MATTYTLKTLFTELRDFLADIQEDRFNERDLVTALNNAVRWAWPKWFTTVIDDTTYRYSATDFDYTLPASMDDVVEIYLEPRQAKPWKKVTGWTVRENSVGTKNIFFTQVYRQFDGQRMRIIGVRRPATFKAVKGDTGVGNGTTTFTDANATFVTNGVAIGDKLYIIQSGNNDAAKGEYNIASVTSETTLTVDTAIPSASQCVYVIVDPDETVDLPYSYLLHMAAHFLYLMWGHRGVGKDVDVASQWAQYHYERALLELEEERKRHRPSGL